MKPRVPFVLLAALLVSSCGEREADQIRASLDKLEEIEERAQTIADDGSAAPGVKSKAEALQALQREALKPVLAGCAGEVREELVHVIGLMAEAGNSVGPESAASEAVRGQLIAYLDAIQGCYEATAG